MAKESYYCKEAADYAVAFIQALRHTTGIWDGKPFELIDWQEQIIRDIFGILKPNGYRQFNTAYIEVPKKNGKSELAAAVALLLTCGDGEQRAKVYSCASDKNQARIVFDVAMAMVRKSPALSKRVKITESTKTLFYIPTESTYQVLSADVASKHGFNTHGVIFDELHTQPNRKLYDVMTKGSGDARMQPLYFLITTAGDNTNSICYEVHQKALDILNGRKHDPTFYPVIFGADPDDDWTDPKVWKKANPSLGITVGIDKVKAACESAKQNPAEENSFRQLRLNQWVKQTVRWMPMDKWDACAFPVDPKMLEGRVCYGGLDLSSSIDITAFVLVFPPEDEDDKYIVLPYYWIPEDNVDLRVKRDHVNYDLWIKQGYLKTTEGNVVHYGFIEKFIEELGTKYNIREIAFDRWGAVQMVQNLEGMGFTVVPFGQGFKDMSPPTKELMKLTLEQKIAHGGHPVLRWMMDNIFIRTDPAGNIKLDKEKSTEKIDGTVDNYSAIKEYVGGDAYNYIIGASLVGGRISGVFAMKAIFISVGILIFCAGLICLSFVKKEDNQLASLQTNASQEEQSTELNCSNLEISEISNNT
jgi:phage terminase large subunit-like protein